MMRKHAGARKGGKKKPGKSAARIKQLWNQAGQFSSAGNLIEEEKALRSILELEPDHYGCLVRLSAMAQRKGKLSIALGFAKQAVQVNHGEALGHLLLGQVLVELGLAELAEAELTIAQQLNGEDPLVFAAFGRLLEQQGHTEKADEAYRRAIALKPDFVAGYFSLAANKKFQPGDPDIRAIEKLLEHDAQLSQEEKLMLHFTLAKVNHDCGEYDQAFLELQQANRLKREQLQYSSKDQQQFTDLMLQTQNESFVSRLKDVGCAADSPVFVLGMPRSGSTLLESLLSRHPDIRGIGEVPYIYNLAHGCRAPLQSELPYPQFLADLSPQLCLQLGEDYVRLTHQFGVEARRIIDKMPDNFLLVGFILAVLPNARIIHCKRNPVDTCLSIYQQYFANSGLAYAYDLREIGEYYVQYQRCMDHWHQLYPEQICDVSYEDLVADSEKEMRRLIDFCDLPWDERCLRENGSELKIRTASVWQARQPVYRTSVQRWRQYEKHLSPLLEALQPVLVEGTY